MAILEWDKKKDVNSNGAIISLFYQGLKENIKNKLIYDKTKISNFTILIKRAITINDKLYFQAIEKNPEKNIQSRVKYAPSPEIYKRILFYPQKNLIKLDNLQVSTAKKEKKKGKDGKPILNYYIYRKPGHIAKNYRSKNKV